MKAYKFNHRDRMFAPWATLCVLSLIAALVFASPSVVFAQTNTYELSQDCETAMVETPHTIMVKVTDGGAPVADVSLWYMVQAGPNGGIRGPIGATNDDGITEFTYTGGSTSGTDTIWLIPPPPNNGLLATISTEWTAEDLCLAPQVQVGGKVTLNAKKRGALKIAVCGTKDFEVSNVKPESVRLAGVQAWHWKQKDSRLCLDGKDGFVDLVLKFKNREVVEALGPDLENTTDGVPLALTGELNNGTAFGGEWVAEIKKKGKRHGKNKQYQDHGNGNAIGHNK
ncbi:MAG: hypothetical protein P8X67_17385 [Syntrophobacterales bacterium]